MFGDLLQMSDKKRLLLTMKKDADVVWDTRSDDF